MNARPAVLPVAWPYADVCYATDETYRRVADWLAICPTVADWGGGGGYLARFLPATVRYTLVDGTLQAAEQVLADLTRYRRPSDGIALRHVLDATPAWEDILTNALCAFRHRLVVVTFLPEARATTRVPKKHGYPYWQFNFADLRARMSPWLVREDDVETSHTEHLFYLERVC